MHFFYSGFFFRFRCLMFFFRFRYPMFFLGFHYRFFFMFFCAGVYLTGRGNRRMLLIFRFRTAFRMAFGTIFFTFRPLRFLLRLIFFIFLYILKILFIPIRFFFCHKLSECRVLGKQKHGLVFILFRTCGLHLRIRFHKGTNPSRIF